MALLSLFVFNMDWKPVRHGPGKHGIKVLILCMGNTCRSQMAHGFMASYGDDVAGYIQWSQRWKRVN